MTKLKFPRKYNAIGLWGFDTNLTLVIMHITTVQLHYSNIGRTSYTTSVSHQIQSSVKLCLIKGH